MSREAWILFAVTMLVTAGVGMAALRRT